MSKEQLIEMSELTGVPVDQIEEELGQLEEKLQLMEFFFEGCKNVGRHTLDGKEYTSFELTNERLETLKELELTGFEDSVRNSVILKGRMTEKQYKVIFK